MSFIKLENVCFNYINSKENQKIHNVLHNLNIDIKSGEFVCIIGKNGSGKSTFAKLLNALLLPTEGTVFINNMSSKNSETLWEIRKNVGMVFQNPDNQLVSTIVEDDISFGLENLGLSPEEIENAIKYSLNKLDMTKYRLNMTYNLSGGQKQKIAIAGILAMKPKCIVFDESTAMLDPLARQDLINTIITLNKESNITIILVTHHMEEAINSDRIIVMNNGEVILNDAPRNVFLQKQKLNELNLELPYVTQIASFLNENGYNIKKDCLYEQELISEIIKIGFRKDIDYKSNKPINIDSQTIIKIKDLNYVYNKNTSFEKKALDNINLDIKKGEILGIIGKTGSGKSTFIQHLNGLIKSDKGKIFFKNTDIWEKPFNLKEIRLKVGIVFQYPENQLFEETVYKDVAFAPKNMGLDEKEIQTRVKEALEFVGLDETFFDKNPFELSGGQKRRVAIAGILAMKPEVLVFDEPTAGLDPVTRNLILNNIKNINKKLGTTVILISHSMEDVVNFADRFAIMKDGRLTIFNTAKEAFCNIENLKSFGLKLPKITEIFYKLNQIRKDIPFDIFTMDEAKEFFLQNLNRKEDK